MQVSLFASATNQFLADILKISSHYISRLDILNPVNHASSIFMNFNNFRETFHPEQLDIYWENLVLALIGETIDEGDEICGCRVVDKSPRKGMHQT